MKFVSTLVVTLLFSLYSAVASAAKPACLEDFARDPLMQIPYEKKVNFISRGISKLKDAGINTYVNGVNLTEINDATDKNCTSIESNLSTKGKVAIGLAVAVIIAYAVNDGGSGY